MSPCAGFPSSFLLLLHFLVLTSLRLHVAALQGYTARCLPLGLLLGKHSPSARRKRGRTLDAMAVPSMDVSQSIEEEMPDFFFCGTTTSKKFLAFPNICFDEDLGCRVLCSTA
ncbi:uncharacterized protein LOC125539379 isoform X2 [Triticum urartu]|uniref:uncharacterized protein LOC125539379 isoform X2 n=1 Tax=Triticum urartu TaxID=4572 RepID=UPI0020444B15|nr:uncharacterized protein LOC125539379 isoform X2 [Triticum urartu]